MGTAYHKLMCSKETHGQVNDFTSPVVKIEVLRAYQIRMSILMSPFDFLPDYVMALNPMTWESKLKRTAYLISPPVTMKRGLCMRFTYWAAGVALNRLSVYLQDSRTKIMRLFFTTIPKEDWTWEEVQLALPRKNTYNVCCTLNCRLSYDDVFSNWIFTFTL